MTRSPASGLCPAQHIGPSTHHFIMSGRSKGGKGLGKGGAKRHHKVLGQHPGHKPAIRRLARRGAVKRISGLIYEETAACSRSSSRTSSAARHLRRRPERRSPWTSSTHSSARAARSTARRVSPPPSPGRPPPLTRPAVVARCPSHSHRFLLKPPKNSTRPAALSPPSLVRNQHTVQFRPARPPRRPPGHLGWRTPPGPPGDHDRDLGREGRLIRRRRFGDGGRGGGAARGSAARRPGRALRRAIRPAPVVARPALVPLQFVVRPQRRARPAAHASPVSERAAAVVVGLRLLDINLVLVLTRRRTRLLLVIKRRLQRIAAAPERRPERDRLAADAPPVVHAAHRPTIERERARVDRARSKIIRY